MAAEPDDAPESELTLSIEGATESADSREAPGLEPSHDEKTFTYGHALVLGIVEGVTEYLPVSSTGHLILAKAALGLDSIQATPTDSGRERAANHFELSFGKSLDAYLIVIQFGAIAAVLLVFWKYALKMGMGLLGRDHAGLLLLRNILVAFLPAVALGLLLEDWIDTLLFGPWPVAAALALGAFIMLGAEAWRRRQQTGYEGGPQLHELGVKQALIIGFCQCLALWPGMSRSMSAMVGGYVAGLTPRRSAEFSFLLGLPTLGGASVYKGLKAGPEMLESLGWGQVVFGCVVAALAAGLAVRWLVSFLSRHGLAVFAWYRLALAAVVILLLVWA